ncbi:hypothetical protein Q7P37_001498 [Cladosporium fusiforme]
MSESSSRGSKPPEKRHRSLRSNQEYHGDTYLQGKPNSVSTELSQQHIVRQPVPSTLPQLVSPGMSPGNSSAQISLPRTAARSNTATGQSSPQTHGQGSGAASSIRRSFDELTAFTGGSTFSPWQAPVGRPVHGHAYPATPRPTTTTGTEVDLGPPPSDYGPSYSAPLRPFSGIPPPRRQSAAQDPSTQDPDIVAHYQQQGTQRHYQSHQK